MDNMVCIFADDGLVENWLGLACAANSKAVWWLGVEGMHGRGKCCHLELLMQGVYGDLVTEAEWCDNLPVEVVAEGTCTQACKEALGARGCHNVAMM